MPAVSVGEDVLRDCVRAFRSVAEYELEPALDRRLLDLGERKEFLTADQHAELLDLVAFAQHRSQEKLEARLALRRLAEIVTDVVREA